MEYLDVDLFLTLPRPTPTMQPESSDGFASVGTILPRREPPCCRAALSAFAGCFSGSARFAVGKGCFGSGSARQIAPSRYNSSHDCAAPELSGSFFAAGQVLRASTRRQTTQ